ncbi:MAG: hypothetical protein ACYCTW_06830, partial [Sulfuricella sp.]
KRLTEQPNADGSESWDLWGQKELLPALEKDARDALRDLIKFVGSLPEEEQKRIAVSISHTLIPFGAYVRDPDKDWGKMAIKMLPVGAMRDIRSPVLRINRREDKSLYHYYLTYLKVLFMKSKHVAGGWKADADLRDGMDKDTLAGIDEAISERTRKKELALHD